MITLDASQIERASRALEHLPGGAERAMARAINRAIEGARASLAKGARARYRVSGAEIRKTMRLQRATPKKLGAAVLSVGPGIPLHAFGPTPSEPGTGGPGKPQLRVTVRRGQAKRTTRGLFVGRLRGRHWVLKRKGPKRFPLMALRGPAVPQMLGQADVVAAAERLASDRLDKRLDHEIGVLLQRLERRRAR